MGEIKVCLATPTYDGQVVPPFAESIKGTLELLAERDIEATWKTWAGCCYLPIARNKLVKQFLEGDYTDLVFLDADIEWCPEDILRLLAWPVEMVAGVYRVKEHEDRYPLWLKTDSEGLPVFAGLSELIECWAVPTGFLRITRSVFLDMQRHYGESLEVDEHGANEELIGSYLNFFDTEKRGRQWFGEDVNFCRRWTMEMGRPLYVDPQIPLTHWGVYPSGHPRAFPGDYHDYLSRLPGGANDPGYQGTDIPGYLTRREAQWLYSKAKSMSSIVEVGSFAGRSAHALLSGCKGPVLCVDPWRPIDWHDAAKDIGIADDEEAAETRFQAFLENTSGFSNRSVLRTTSLEAVKEVADQSIDMVWIDADHSHEAVAQDIKAWLPKARKLICGHDYDEWGWPGVKRAVDEAFGSRVLTYASIWYVVL